MTEPKPCAESICTSCSIGLGSHALRLCSGTTDRASECRFVCCTAGTDGRAASVASAVTLSVEGAQAHEAAAAASEPPAQSVADGVTRSIARASLASADGESKSASAIGEAQSVADGVTRSIESTGGQAANGAPTGAGSSGRSRSGRLLLPNSVQLVRSCARTSVLSHKAPTLSFEGKGLCRSARVEQGSLSTNASFEPGAEPGIVLIAWAPAVTQDWCLWETGEAQRNGDLQHHRTRTIYY